MNHLGGKEFSKRDRLLKRCQYLYLSGRGKSVANRYFIAAFQYNGLERSRLGITVTKKTGNAVVRNRIKRLVREFFRQNRQLFSTGVDINVIAKKAAAYATAQQTFAALQQLFGKVGRHTN